VVFRNGESADCPEPRIRIGFPAGSDQFAISNSWGGPALPSPFAGVVEGGPHSIFCGGPYQKLEMAFCFHAANLSGSAAAFAAAFAAASAWRIIARPCASVRTSFHSFVALMASMNFLGIS
jgi:hypothetical protein